MPVIKLEIATPKVILFFLDWTASFMEIATIAQINGFKTHVLTSWLKLSNIGVTSYEQ